MTYFKAGGIPTPDYDTEDINYVSQKTEFTEDVFVYGKLYAELGGDVQTFSTNGVERIRITKEGDIIFSSNNVSISGVTTVATLNVSGNTNLSGITTGTFVGDGSGLTGVIGVGQGIEVQDNSSVVGAAGTVNFDTNLDVVSFSAGAVTVRGSQNFTGVVTATTFKGNGDFVELDVDGHTNLDNVSIAGFTTITQDLDVDGHTNLDNVSIAGVSTFNGELNLSRIRLGPGNAINDDANIEWLGGNNDGYLRISTSDDSGAEYIELGDYDHVDLGGTFTQWMKLNRTELYMARDVRLNAGLEDKDGEKGNSGQVLSSTGTQTNWIDMAGGLVAQARSASDSSTSTQFNPVGYVDKLTLTVSGVQSTSKILLFFRMTLQHSGSGTTLGQVTGPSLFGGDTQFSVASNPGSQTFSGVLFDASSSTTREFKIQYADNGGVSSAILNTELFAVELKVS